MKSSFVVKRSIVVDHHKTSVSLEDDFWNALRDIAHGRGETVSKLITGIDGNRQATNLSSGSHVCSLALHRSVCSAARNKASNT